jgi:cytidylate kinase
MSSNLLSYLSQRYYGIKNEEKQAGPYLTISRETGCNATFLASSLTKQLRKRGLHWRFVNKEILEKSAERLHLDKNKLEHEFLISRDNAMDDIIKALSSRYYKTDKKIRETIADIIRFEARQGNTIIVGRAGAITTSDIPGGLHIRLVAPIAWRIRALSKRKTFSEKEITAYIEDNDRKRNLLLSQYAQTHPIENYFDLMINVSKFTQQETLSIILNTMKLKGFI